MVPKGWIRREKGLVGGATGVSVPTLNGVWPERVDPDRDLVVEILDEIASSGLPYCLQLRSGAPGELTALAAERGMVREQQVPLMVLQDLGRLDVPIDVGELRIRQLAPEEGRLHAVTAARGFEAPEEPFIELATPTVLKGTGVRAYIGEVDGEAVATGLGVTLPPFVGIFNIATVPGHRGRGFATAITARAAADGLASGARWSYLQSSPAGLRVYSRLGYTTLEHWDCWVSAFGSE